MFSPHPKIRMIAECSLRVGFGTEASARDRREFERRFGCTLVEGYGSSEGGLAITRTADTPADALGMPAEGVAVLDPDTGAECKRAVIDFSGGIVNSDEAVGELACRSGVAVFEGYYKNNEADATHGSKTAGTGRATSLTGTKPGSSISPAARMTGSGSTRRTSQPHR